MFFEIIFRGEIFEIPYAPRSGNIDIGFMSLIEAGVRHLASQEACINQGKKEYELQGD